jgi:hypothetical protein
MAALTPLTRQTILVATLAGSFENFRPGQFLSMNPVLAGLDRLPTLLGAVRAAQGRSLTATCDLCLHDGQVPLGDCTVVFATAACRSAWFAARLNPYAPKLATRQSSVPVRILDPHLEMHVDGRCLLRCVLGVGAHQVQSRHVFTRESMVAVEDASCSSEEPQRVPA